MSTIKFKRFTKVNFLTQIGRDLVDQFLYRNRTGLAERQVVLPAATLDDSEYFAAVVRLAKSPEGLPESLVEAAFGIEDMANDEGQERLENATNENGLVYRFRENSTCAEIAMQAWLTNESVFNEKRSEQRLMRVASFDYFGSKPENRDFPFTEPNAEILVLMRSDLETVFRAKNRGAHTTQIEVFKMDGEHWFLIRHGETCVRVPTVADGRVSMLHFRPTKEDAVVYSPQFDELRIHAVRKWEKDLYRETIGQRLFGNTHRFTERKAYTLDPLLVEGADALDVTNIPGLDKVILRETETAWPGEFGDVTVRKSEDIFASAKQRSATAIAESGRLIRATFDFYFTGDDKPRKVHIRLPNILKLSRYCDAPLVNQWIGERGFRAVVVGGLYRESITHVERVALP